MAITFKLFTKDYSRKVEKIVQRNALDFHTTISNVYPIDTGQARAGWQSPQQRSNGVWVVVNNVEHASVLWHGIHTVNGKTYGSYQMPYSADKYTDATAENIKRDIERIR